MVDTKDVGGFRAAHRKNRLVSATGLTIIWFSGVQDQILQTHAGRFGRVHPQGIVVFSDGRARDDAGAAQLAHEFARLKVPVHVMPFGDTSKGGDVAPAAVPSV